MYSRRLVLEIASITVTADIYETHVQLEMRPTVNVVRKDITKRCLNLKMDERKILIKKKLKQWTRNRIWVRIWRNTLEVPIYLSIYILSITILLLEELVKEITGKLCILILFIGHLKEFKDNFCFKKIFNC